MGYGAGSSTSNSTCGANPPPGIRKVNDAVWELHSPSEIPQLEIIFFHGLQLGDYENAFWKTWRGGVDEKVVWPKDWLGKAFPTARILSISYNSLITKSDGQLDMFRLGENLVSDIIMDDLNIGQTCPVILVGHSFGGIVIKQFILSAKKLRPVHESPNFQTYVQKTEKFLENFKAVFYYATPHGGSRIANLAKYTPRSSSAYVKHLETFDKDLARINQDFKILRESMHIRVHAVAEGKPTTYFGFHAFIVEEGSARQDIDTFYTAGDADHFQVCKPKNMTSGNFRQLRILISDMISMWNDLQAYNYKVIEIDVGKIRKLLVKLQDENEESKTSQGREARKSLRGRMEKDVLDASQLVRSVKEKLQRLDRANSGLQSKTKGWEDQTRITSTDILRKTLKDDMEEFVKLRAMIMEEYSWEIVGSFAIDITGKRPDTGTLERIIETGEDENLLQTTIQEQCQDRILETVPEIQERHDGVKEIEKRLLELHQIFLDTVQDDRPNDTGSSVNSLESIVEWLRESSKLSVIFCILVTIEVLLMGSFVLQGLLAMGSSSMEDMESFGRRETMIFGAMVVNSVMLALLAVTYNILESYRGRKRKRTEDAEIGMT